MMRFVVLAAAAAIATPAAAQDHSAHAAPAPAATPAAASKFSLDTPVETLMADPAAKAVVEANVPGIASHESYDMFKSMSLNQLAPMAADKLTPAVLAKVQAGLATIR